MPIDGRSDCAHAYHLLIDADGVNIRHARAAGLVKPRLSTIVASRRRRNKRCGIEPRAGFHRDDGGRPGGHAGNSGAAPVS